MAFQVSPGVNVSEIDLSNVIPAVSVSTGAIAGVFRWGPVNELTLISSEKQLSTVFGEPASYFTDASYTTSWSNYETFFTAANFLSYSNSLYVVRTTGDSAATSVSAAVNTTGGFSAKYPGALGNSLSVSVCSTQSDGTTTGFTEVSNDFSISINPFGYTATDNSTQNRTAGEIVQTGTVSGLLTSSAPADFVSVGDAIELTNGTRLVVSAVAAAVEEYAAGSALNFFTGAVANARTETVEAADISFSASTISSVGENFGVFATGDTIQVSGTTGGTNDGIYRVDSVTSDGAGTNPDVITVVGTNVFTAESAGETITVKQINAITSSDETLTIGDHGLVTGQPVTYSINGGTVLQGLTDATTYFVISVDADNIKLATTAKLAIEGTGIDITAAAANGDTDPHTLTPAQGFSIALTFDSVYSESTAYNSTYVSQWRDSDLFLSAPAASRVHVVVRDEDGEITGTKDTILEVYENASIDPSAVLTDGSTNYIVDILENGSRWISLTTAQATALVTTKASVELSLTGGADGEDESAIAIGSVTSGYDLFKDPANVDISLIMQGKARNTVLGNYIVNNIAEVRKDCVAFVSPEVSDQTATAVIDFAGRLGGSTYLVVDSGYKYQYDKYSDVYRWVPLNGDIAGLCARTDEERDPWFSPAGFNRGIIKNVVRLRFNPTKAERDQLYLNNVNPVITEAGSGTLLFGDKTFSAIPSAFDRINVRRLFIVLEKAISNASKSLLFEFNDEFTRAQFKNLVEPFLREVQGRRGIFDFRVVCDETNNTAQVIDSNQFVGDIFIKPARSINFIQLNFVAVRSGVEFEEIVGAV